jgi:acyl dehydratase
MTLRGSDLSVGELREVIVVDDLTRTQIVQYAGVSGDFNPLHTDERYAVEVAGNPTVMSHGMLVMGLAGKALTDYVGDGRLTEFSGRFVASAWPGDTLRVQLTVAEVDEQANDGPSVRFDIRTLNQDDATVFTGSATARLDA